MFLDPKMSHPNDDEPLMVRFGFRLSLTVEFKTVAPGRSKADRTKRKQHVDDLKARRLKEPDRLQTHRIRNDEVESTNKNPEK